MSRRFLLSIAAIAVVLFTLLIFEFFDSDVGSASDLFGPVLEGESENQEERSELLFSELSLIDFEEDMENRISYRLVSTKVVDYGEGPGQMGLIDEDEQETAGPESFAIDGEGNFVVCDTLNQRIHLLSRDGLSVEFDLPTEIAPGDVAVYQSESIVVYDYAGWIHQFDFEGNRTGAVEFDRDRWYARLEMRLVGDHVFVQSADQVDHLVGVFEKGNLRLPSEEELRKFEDRVGAHGASGRRYVAHLERWERGSVDIWDLNGDLIGRMALEIPGIVSVRFLGEDSARNVFVQVERVEDGGVALEVHQFDSAGEAVAKVDIPENDYYFWTAKLLSIDADGNIYQSLPQPEGMKFNVFQPFKEGES